MYDGSAPAPAIGGGERKEFESPLASLDGIASCVSPPIMGGGGSEESFVNSPVLAVFATVVVLVVVPADALGCSMVAADGDASEAG